MEEYTFNMWLEEAYKIAYQDGKIATPPSQIPFFFKWFMFYPFYLFQKYILGVKI